MASDHGQSLLGTQGEQQALLSVRGCDSSDALMHGHHWYHGYHGQQLGSIDHGS
jgi:hypothetical protein